VTGATVLQRDVDGAWVVDAALVAPGLGLLPEKFMQALQSGLVFQTHETGTGADAGTYRLTFRYRAREWRLLVAENGAVMSAEPGPNDPRAHL
jgi:hypothetical protein